MHIWVDADATPGSIKEIIFRAAVKREIQTTAVANRFMHIPRSPFIHFQLVSKGSDEADAYIVAKMAPGDLVITADIPLADQVIKKEGIAIDPRGYTYTEANIRERMSIRSFMEDLRSSGFQGGGPKSFNDNNTKQFAGSFDRILTKSLKSSNRF